MKRTLFLFIAFVLAFCSCKKDNVRVQEIKSANDCYYCYNCGWDNDRVTMYTEYSKIYIIPNISGALSFTCTNGDGDRLWVSSGYHSEVHRGDIVTCRVQKNDTVCICFYTDDGYFYTEGDLTLEKIKIVWDGIKEENNNEENNNEYNDF